LAVLLGPSVRPHFWLGLLGLLRLLGLLGAGLGDGAGTGRDLVES
jgi:hypothetical protein